LEELAGSVQVLMKSQVALLDALQGQQQKNAASAAAEGNGPILSQQNNLQDHKETLQSQLSGSFFASRARTASYTTKNPGDSSRDSSTIGSISLNRVDDDLLRAAYLGGMATDELDATPAQGLPPRPKIRLQFDGDAGPSTPTFWRDLGLPEDHVQRIMEALNEKSLQLVQQQQKQPNDVPRQAADVLSQAAIAASLRQQHNQKGSLNKGTADIARTRSAPIPRKNLP
jgi:hypothetical protein